MVRLLPLCSKMKLSSYTIYLLFLFLFPFFYLFFSLFFIFIIFSSTSLLPYIYDS